MLISF
jgi:AP-1-like transcription factor